MYENLKAAAHADSTDLLYAHIQEDPYALERIDVIPFIHTPLHVAAAGGNIKFATEIIKLKPSFIWKLNEHGFSPMHLALESHNPSMVLRFVQMSKDVIRIKGKDGLTPLHLLSKAGRVKLLAEFLSACPESIEDVTIQSETALHIATKNGQYEALKFLLCWLMSNCKKGASNLQSSMLNWMDEDGNNTFHILAGRNDINLQVVQLLIQGKINLNAKNLAGFTALDIVNSDQNQDDPNIIRIKNILLGAKALSGTDSVPSAPILAETLVKEVISRNFIGKTKIKLNRFRENITNENRNILLVVAVLVATSTNQAALSPPGGVYQSDADKNMTGDSITDYQGASVMDHFSFYIFWAYNTLALLASALAIYILLPPVGRGLTRLLLFPLFYFVFGFFFSMSIIAPSSAVPDNLYSPIVAIGIVVSFIYIYKFTSTRVFRRKSGEI